jgi:pimeloyl-ACP methyl ester carboxylesterase
VALQRWSADDGVARGHVLLLHGLTSIADSWWRMGPALAARGWDVTAVDLAGHGGQPVEEEPDDVVLAVAVRDLCPERPDVLIGHSLGAIAALALLEHHPGWARTVILEDPPSLLDEPATVREVADTLEDRARAVRADRAAVVAQVRADRPAWDDRDVHWAVEGFAEMDAPPFARRLRALAADAGGRPGLADRIVAAAPDAYVLAATGEASYLEGGSALSAASREELERRLPPGHVVAIAGGHCLHRDAPQAWLAAVDAILDGTV